MRTALEIMNTSFAREWRELLLSYPVPVVAQVQALAAHHAATLSQHFYEAMLEEAHASSLLSHEKVQTRLMGSMQQWIKDVLGAGVDADFAALVQRQVQIGQIHARIDVPVHLVLRGARRLKDAGHRLLQAEHTTTAHGACQLLSAIMDHAMEAMSKASFHLPRQQQHPVTISVGVAMFDGHPDYQRILRHSDEALYRAKSLGRNRVVSV